MLSEISNEEAVLSGKFDSRLRVAIIYEDSATGLNAKYNLDRLSHRINLDANPFDVRLWSFDLLAHEELRKSAAREAGDFDIIIFAVRKGELPVKIKSWLQEWLLEREQRPCALSVIFDEQTRQAERMLLIDYLDTVASVSGIDLVLPSPETSKESRNFVPFKEQVRSVLPGGLTLPPWPSSLHCGINE